MTRIIVIPPGLPGDELKAWIRGEIGPPKATGGRARGWYASRGLRAIRRKQVDNRKTLPTVERAATVAQPLPKGPSHA